MHREGKKTQNICEWQTHSHLNSLKELRTGQISVHWKVILEKIGPHSGTDQFFFNERHVLSESGDGCKANDTVIEYVCVRLCVYTHLFPHHFLAINALENLYFYVSTLQMH